MSEFGKTIISIDEKTYKVSLVIQCVKNKIEEIYSEKRINEVSSRVFIDKNSILTVFCKDKDDHGRPLVSEEEAIKRIDNFKNHLIKVQDLKKKLISLVNNGFFDFKKLIFFYDH